MTPEVINAYFTPLDYAYYLSTVVVVYVVVLQWKWAQACKKNILVLIERSKGNGDWKLVPISGNRVEFKEKDQDGKEVTKLWPINELSSVGVLYPGVGFIPQFLQKEIKMVVVNENNWEPKTNRSEKGTPVATPAFLGSLANEKITEALAIVNKEVIDAISKIGNILNPTHFYIGIGLILAVQVFIIFRLTPILEALETLVPLIEVLKEGLAL